MLNSLYGRFGLKYQKHISKFVTFEELMDIELSYQVIENIFIDENIEYVKYSLEPSDVLECIEPEKYNELLAKKY
jgi:hypothetical protein